MGSQLFYVVTVKQQEMFINAISEYAFHAWIFKFSELTHLQETVSQFLHWIFIAINGYWFGLRCLSL